MTNCSNSWSFSRPARSRRGSRYGGRSLSGLCAQGQAHQAFCPLTLRYVAQLFEAMGVAQLVVLEAHSVAAFENAFRCPLIHLEAHRVFDDWLEALAQEYALVVASPDPGGVKRAQPWREYLETRLKRRIGFAIVDKRRSSGVVSSENMVAGDVTNMVVLLLDDLIASGDMVRRAALTLRRAGASKVLAFAAHGLFIGAAARPCR